MFREFRDFIMRGNVVELAVAVIIGAAFGAVVAAFAASFITPLIALFGGQPDFSGLKFSISGTEFLHGEFLNALIAFLIIAAIVFFLVVRPMNRLMQRLKRTDEEPGAPSADVTTLIEIRDLLAAKRGPAGS